MNIKDLLEMELGKSKEHEKIISQREKFLKDKIKEKEKTKEKTLRGIEKVADEFTIMDEKGTLEFIKKYGSDASEEMINFLDFSVKKIEKYFEDKEDIEIPISAIPIAQGMVLNKLIMSLDKVQRKIITEIIKMEKPQNMNDIIKILNTSPEEAYEKLGSKIPGLDIEELEEFVDTISKDKEIKDKINKINNSLNRLYSIYAKNKHLSDLGSTKKIKL